MSLPPAATCSTICRLLVGLTFALTLTSTAPAAAESRHILHTVKEGDSLRLLAAEYYGDRRHAVFIMVANNLSHPRPLKPGEKIKIPVGKDVTAAAGDTFESLAAAHLGDERRAEFLAVFNGRTDFANASIAAGEELRIPLRVNHTAAAKVSLADIAATYLGDRKKGEFLKRYNFLDKDTLEPGETIIIPILRVRVTREKLPPPDEESTARSHKRREIQEQAQRVLPVATAAWRAGDYATIRLELAKIDTDYLDVDAAIEIGLLLGSTYIAFDDTPSAVAAFRKIIERRPHHELSPYHHSPKVCEVWQQAGGEIGAPE